MSLKDLRPFLDKLNNGTKSPNDFGVFNAGKRRFDG